MHPAFHGRQRIEQPPPAIDPVAEVWRCRSKKLTAPRKRAFEYLYRVTEGGRKAVLLSAADVGQDQGTSSDAGKDCLDDLADQGFAIVQPWGKKGTYKVELGNWTCALRALGQKDERPLLDSLDGHQNTSLPSSEARPFGDVAGAFGSGLSPGDEGLAGFPPEEAPEVPPEDPRRLFIPSEEERYISQPSTFGKPSVNRSIPNGAEGSRGGSSGGSSADEAAFLRDASSRRQAISFEQNRRPDTGLERPMLARLASLPSPEQQEQAAEQRAQIIFQRVNCPRMRMAPCVRMAWHVVEGRIDWKPIAQLLKLLDQLDQAGQLGCPRSAYANRGFDKICRDHGVPLPPRANKPR